jgi:RNA polymerase sporulation-specific sigma factor
MLISAEEVEGLRESMTEVLSELEINVLHLYMDGKSYQEIAGLLGRHVKSIDNALQRIKRKLEHHLTTAPRNIADAPGRSVIG